MTAKSDKPQMNESNTASLMGRAITKRINVDEISSRVRKFVRLEYHTSLLETCSDS